MAQGSIAVAVALACAAWSLFIWVVQSIGCYKIFRHLSSAPCKPVSPTLSHDEIPHVTIIRPAKGLDPSLYECLASTFRQLYPREKLTICLCVSSESDPAYKILERVVADFPGFDARVLVEEQDPFLHGEHGHANHLGPNPKIRNVSRAYREARDGVIWIADCNVWLSKGAAGRMVDKLCGFRPGGRRAKPYKFVHHLPLVVDIGSARTAQARSLLRTDSAPAVAGPNGGSRLDEMFMATTHAKFYSAINAVGVAPCIVGKSNMFRKVHLDRLTDPARNPTIAPADARRGRGIDFFSSIICEDHIIGEVLWKSDMPGYRNHGLLYGDLAIQPIAGMSIAAYIGRRVRWLRVRKWTVILATLVEPGVESLLCSAYFSYAATTLPWMRDVFGIPQTWSTMGRVWFAAVFAWACVDRIVYDQLHKLQSVEVDDDTPIFARGTARRNGLEPKSLGTWLLAWLGRELLALPIWTWAVLLGTTVNWRGKIFKVRSDMTVVEAGPTETIPKHNGHALPTSNGKARDA
ncbi:hypothetical protein P8C59_005832 [Phyllachora maydis]|uniref:Ceramide glucosyltransferase n=1 Tax=Phyllachora maydis TaxID=1825666 RepID=A0AAD9I545_9PEZI|nr:hypothetical protein P8C59_005832 [Phyllachora maydis]